MTNFHRIWFQNFRQFSNLFSQIIIWLNDVCREPSPLFTKARWTAHPRFFIAVINDVELSRARECVRTSAHLGLIRWRKRDEKNCRLIGKWRSMLDVGSSFSMCILTHAWALWEDQIRKPKLKKRMLGRVRRNLVNPSIPKMEVLDASF